MFSNYERGSVMPPLCEVNKWAHPFFKYQFYKNIKQILKKYIVLYKNRSDSFVRVFKEYPDALTDHH